MHFRESNYYRLNYCVKIDLFIYSKIYKIFKILFQKRSKVLKVSNNHRYRENDYFQRNNRKKRD